MIELPDTHLADQVMTYITGARWFAGKGRLVALRSLTPLPWLNEVSDSVAGRTPAVRTEIAELAYDNGPREFYQLPLAYRAAPQPELHYAEVARLTHPELGSVVAYDAARDPEACRVLLRALLEEK